MKQIIFCGFSCLLASAAIHAEPIADTDAKLFLQSLSDKTITPEQRAVLIEQWRLSHDSPTPISRAASPASQQVSPLKPATLFEDSAPLKIPAPVDPLLADIHETEAEIRAIARNIAASNITPEQRAIQIEQFTQLNRETFAQLKQLKQQATQKLMDQAALSRPSVTDAPPSELTQRREELRALFRNLDALDPEARARFIETQIHSSDSKPLAPANNIQVTNPTHP